MSRPDIDNDATVVRARAESPVAPAPDNEPTVVRGHQAERDTADTVVRAQRPSRDTADTVVRGNRPRRDTDDTVVTGRATGAVDAAAEATARAGFSRVAFVPEHSATAPTEHYAIHSAHVVTRPGTVSSHAAHRAPSTGATADDVPPMFDPHAIVEAQSRSVRRALAIIAGVTVAAAIMLVVGVILIIRVL